MQLFVSQARAAAASSSADALAAATEAGRFNQKQRLHLFALWCFGSAVGSACCCTMCFGSQCLEAADWAIYFIAMHAGVVLAQQDTEADSDTPSEEGRAESGPVKLFAGQHISNHLRPLLPAYHFSKQLTCSIAFSSLYSVQTWHSFLTCDQYPMSSAGGQAAPLVNQHRRLFGPSKRSSADLGRPSFMHGLRDLQAEPGVASSSGPLFLLQPVLQPKGSAEAEHQQARFAADPGLRKLFGAVSEPLAAWRHVPAVASRSSNSQSASKQSVTAEISISIRSSIVGGAADSSYSPRRLFESGSSLGQQSPMPGTDSIPGGLHRQLLADAAASPLNITVNIQVGSI